VPIVAAELPADALESVRRAVSATGRFPRRRGGALSLSLPHQVFSVSLEALTAEKPLIDAADFTGWRVLVEEDQAVVAAAEVGRSDGHGGQTDATINRGTFAHSMVEALRAAEQDKRIASARFEVRLLRVVALYVVAVWLHSSEPDSDLFVPLSPAPAPLSAGATYPTLEFQKDLADMANRMLSAYQTAERPDELGS
jgi:hypothetical protein